MKFLEPNLQAQPLLSSWRGVVSASSGCYKTQKVRVPSLASPRVLHEAKEVAAGVPGRAANTDSSYSWLRADIGSCSSLILVVSYTMFSAPGRGPCGGPRSCLLCSWASCRTGMLHSGHTFRTSSHLIRHLQSETPQEGRCQACAHGIPAHMPHVVHMPVTQSWGWCEQLLARSPTGWRMHFSSWKNQSLQFSQKGY